MKSASIIAVVLLMVGLATAEIKNKGWWKDTVFYQIYPRSFMDSDNDGVGDLKGITSKLKHFVDSGIGAIWLSPINKSPMVDFGYDISDFRDIDETFGTLKDFEVLVKEAKKLGVKVILDLVPNHSSDKHDWFQRSRNNETGYRDYYLWVDGKNGKNDKVNPPNNWISVFGGPAWTYDEKRGQWYFHQFEYRQPDLNYRNKKVQQEMKEIMEFWLNKGVDGFRIDAVPHLYEDEMLKDEPRTNAPGISDKEYKYLEHIYTKDHPETYELVSSWRKILDDYADKHNTSEKVMMTEAYTSLENTTRFYNHGSHIPFNFKFIMDVNASSKPADFKRVIDEWMNAKPKDTVANWVMGNHDRSRTASRYPGRADQMTMLAMLLPGVAVTYNGEEIGMLDNTNISYEETQDPQGKLAGPDKYKTQSRDPCRTPFQWSNATSAGFSKNKVTWLPIPNNYVTLNLEKQKAAAKSHYQVYKTLTNLRKTSDAVKNGGLITLAVDNDILVVIRNGTQEVVTLVINFSKDTTKSVNLVQSLNDRESTIILTSTENKETEIGKKYKTASIQVPPMGSVVFHTDGPINSSTSLILSDYLKVIFVLVFASLFRS